MEIYPHCVFSLRQIRKKITSLLCHSFPVLRHSNCIYYNKSQQKKNESAWPIYVVNYNKSFYALMGLNAIHLVLWFAESKHQRIIRLSLEQHPSD